MKPTKVVASTTVSAPLADKKRMVQASIYMQTGQIKTNLRRHERPPNEVKDLPF